jgi:hypothetical protein
VNPATAAAEPGTTPDTRIGAASSSSEEKSAPLAKDKTVTCKRK